MRIVSKFKDYYDCLSDPTDKSHTWVRKSEVIKEGRRLRDYSFGDDNYFLEIVGFCGKLYPCLTREDRIHTYYSFGDLESHFDHKILGKKPRKYVPVIVTGKQGYNLPQNPTISKK